MSIFDHPYVKRAEDFVNLQSDRPKDDLFIVYEFAVWLSHQMETPKVDSKVVRMPVAARNPKIGGNAWG